MIRRPPESTRTDTLCPDPTRFRATAHRTTLLAWAAAVAAAPLPAWVMCDMRVIENRSIEDSAAYILRYADIVGIGYVTTIDNAERKQQIFAPVVLAKGEGSRFELIPTRKIGSAWWRERVGESEEMQGGCGSIKK